MQKKAGKMNITARFGFSEDCKNVRKKVFIEEQGFKEEFDKTDAFAEHVVLYDGDIPVATGRVFVTNASEYEYTIGRVAVIKEYRGMRLGSRIIEELEKKACSLGAKSILISSQLRAMGFYRALGYVPFGEEYFDEHCPHRMMKKTAVDKGSV